MYIPPEEKQIREKRERERKKKVRVITDTDCSFSSLKQKRCTFLYVQCGGNPTSIVKRGWWLVYKSEKKSHILSYLLGLRKPNNHLTLFSGPS